MEEKLESITTKEKTNERANTAGNVVLATDLLLINTQLPPNPPYISPSARTLQRRPARTSGKQKDHQDLALIPGAAPPAQHFSQLPPSSGAARCRLLLNSCLESAGRTLWNRSYSKAFDSMYLLQSSSGNCSSLELFSSNKIELKIYLYFAQSSMKT